MVRAGAAEGLTRVDFLEGTHRACHPKRSEGSLVGDRDPSLRLG